MQTLIPKFMGKSNPSGAEPVPNNALMNETMNFTMSVKPETTYLFRVVNIGAFAGQYLWFEGHKMQIVEVDGIYTEEAEAEMIYLSAAQRVSFLLTTKKDNSKNFPIVASMDTVSAINPKLDTNRLLTFPIRHCLMCFPKILTTTPLAGLSTIRRLTNRKRLLSRLWNHSMT